VTLEGRKVLLGLGSRESYEDWLDFGRDLLARGMRPPALVIADGAPGLWKAARELWPATLEQRCTVHALRNVTKKLPQRHHRELKARYWRILDEATSVADARAGLRALAADYRAAYPSAAAVIERDLDAPVCHLRFPSEHRKRIRSTNLLERTFVEVRRRTKAIGRFPGETSALCLIWAVLELSSRGWRGVVMTPRAVAEIERLRRGQTSEANQSTTEEVIAA
jgi:putative transposase